MGFSVKISDARSKFSAAHFLYQHDKCSRLHGHNYLVQVEVSGNLNDKFFVVDFFELKASLMKIVNRMDHHLLIPTKSNKMRLEQNPEQNSFQVDFNGKYYIFPVEDVCLLPIEATTAELLAYYIYTEMKKDFNNYKISVEVGESEGSVARYSEN